MEFSSADSLGSLPLAHIASYLIEIGDEEGAQALTAHAVQAQSILGFGAAWKQTGSKIGFIRPDVRGLAAPVVAASQIEGDVGLIGSQIKVSFDGAYIHSYPGSGNHKILCEFVGKNQIDGETEALRMALRFRCGDKAFGSLQSAPIFLGLTVGPNGVSFEGRAVNVSSDDDEQLLQALDTSAFKSGLALVKSVQPALVPLVKLVQSSVSLVAGRSKNRQVHEYNLGLDFANTSTSARLRYGSYVVVQSDSADWNWANFEWDKGATSLRRKIPSEHGIDFNYTVFSVAPYTPMNPSLPLGRRRSNSASSRDSNL